MEQRRGCSRSIIGAPVSIRKTTMDERGGRHIAVTIKEPLTNAINVTKMEREKGRTVFERKALADANKLKKFGPRIAPVSWLPKGGKLTISVGKKVYTKTDKGFNMVQNTDSNSKRTHYIKEERGKNTKNGKEQHTKNGKEQHTKDGKEQHTNHGTEQHTKDGKEQHTKEGKEQHITDEKKRHTKDGRERHTEDGKERRTKDAEERSTKDANERRINDGEERHIRNGMERHTKIGKEQHTKEEKERHTYDGKEKHTKNEKEHHNKNGKEQRAKDGEERRTKDGKERQTKEGKKLNTKDEKKLSDSECCEMKKNRSESKKNFYTTDKTTGGHQTKRSRKEDGSAAEQLISTRANWNDNIGLKVEEDQMTNIIDNKVIRRDPLQHIRAVKKGVSLNVSWFPEISSSEDESERSHNTGFINQLQHATTEPRISIKEETQSQEKHSSTGKASDSNSRRTRYNKEDKMKDSKEEKMRHKDEKKRDTKDEKKTKIEQETESKHETRREDNSKERIHIANKNTGLLGMTNGLIECINRKIIAFAPVKPILEKSGLNSFWFPDFSASEGEEEGIDDLRLLKQPLSSRAKDKVTFKKDTSTREKHSKTEQVLDSITEITKPVKENRSKDIKERNKENVIDGKKRETKTDREKHAKKERKTESRRDMRMEDNSKERIHRSDKETGSSEKRKCADEKHELRGKRSREDDDSTIPQPKYARTSLSGKTGPEVQEIKESKEKAIIEYVEKKVISETAGKVSLNVSWLPDISSSEDEGEESHGSGLLSQAQPTITDRMKNNAICGKSGIAADWNSLIERTGHSVAMSEGHERSGGRGDSRRSRKGHSKKSSHREKSKTGRRREKSFKA